MSGEARAIRSHFQNPTNPNYQSPIYYYMIIPTRQQAENYLNEGQERNPGPWVDHSWQVAKTAHKIAVHHPEIEPECAYILGLLHDM